MGRALSYDGLGIILGYNPPFHVMFSGWLGFTFKNCKYELMILGERWFWGPLILVMGKCSLCFCHVLKIIFNPIHIGETFWYFF